ncbi:hypothetical protein [Qipengyuania nanhaisediminis]|uniref:hypothetical protein n=1 Tax=Qipengyuania nanhaisediminis TaxID=604088 RepID=UPI0038B3E18F
MTMIAFLAASSALAMQAAPVPEPGSRPDAPAIASLDQLPIEQAAAPRCALAFAMAIRWRNAGMPAGDAHGDLDAGTAREFFVRALARLIDDTGMTSAQVASLMQAEVARLDNEAGAERVAAMMPACRVMKEAAGL